MSFAPSTEPQLSQVLMFDCWYRIMLFSKALQRHQVMAITSSLRPKQHSRRITVCLKKGKMEEDTSNMEGERKADMIGGQTPLTGGQSIVFSRLDLTDSSVSTMPVNKVVDSSVRTLNLGYTPARTSSPAMSAATIGSVNAPTQTQHVANSTSFASAASGFHLQRHRNEQQPQCIGNSSTTMLLLYHPVM
ncbi:hypothetical protein D5086_006111 [Populus alba]|uniref:Uncharacterized protein n=1 Tax=Populus alba TaxID=43335 RepID=A0ACC4CJH2_POPAL